MNYIYKDGELYHYGVKGMRWGVRRYQNKDGSLTTLGKKRVKEDGSFKSNKEYNAEIYAKYDAVREKYNKKYGVKKAYEEADEIYYKRCEKNDYVDEDEITEIYAKASSLHTKMDNDTRREMRELYGKDFERLESKAKFKAYAAVTGIMVGATGIFAGGLMAIEKGAPKLVDLGIKAVGKILRKMR